MAVIRQSNKLRARAAVMVGTGTAAPTGNMAVHPMVPGGIFDNDVIPNLNATYRITSAQSPERWTFYAGGAYTFNRVGASAGTYVAIYEVLDWNGAGANASATITETVT